MPLMTINYQLPDENPNEYNEELATRARGELDRTLQSAFQTLWDAGVTPETMISTVGSAFARWAISAGGQPEER